MRDILLQYYRRELSYLRTAGSAFSARYPKIGSRLELGVDECPDPHIERLIESFAFLSAGVQKKIDDELPIISASLLQALYPHLVNPAPSMAVAQFTPSPALGELQHGRFIPVGTPLFIDTEGETQATVRFRTCSPVTLLPLQVMDASLEPAAAHAFLDARPDVAGVLRLQLGLTPGAASTIDSLGFDSLRFYIDGDRLSVFWLYEMLFSKCLGSALVADPKPDGKTNRDNVRFLPADNLVEGGYSDDEAALPFSSSSHPGYRLLQEYFLFPEKFLFFEIGGLASMGAQKSFDLFFLLSSSPAKGPKRLVVNKDTFRLGCATAINLFRTLSEPIRLDGTKNRYLLEPDARRGAHVEVHSIEWVTAYEPGRVETRSFQPYFAYNHHMEDAKTSTFWTAERVPSIHADRPGTDMFLSFTDVDFNPSLPPTESVHAAVLCANRHLAEEIPAGASMQIDEGLPVSSIRLLAKPSRQIDPPMGGALLWRLMSQLSLNHLSLTSDEDGLTSLREILRLYCFPDDAFSVRQINGLRELTSRPAVHRVGPDAWRGFCRGVDVELTFDESMYAGGSALLMAAVLRRFLALYASVNTYTSLRVSSRQRKGVWKQWPPTAGDRIVL